jgi:hypothetical protein
VLIVLDEAEQALAARTVLQTSHRRYYPQKNIRAAGLRLQRVELKCLLLWMLLPTPSS